MKTVKVGFYDGMFDFNGQAMDKDAVMQTLDKTSQMSYVCINNCIVTRALLDYLAEKPDGVITVRAGFEPLSEWDEVSARRAHAVDSSRGRWKGSRHNSRLRG